MRIQIHMTAMLVTASAKSNLLTTSAVAAAAPAAAPSPPGLIRNEFESLPLQLPLGTAAAKALAGPVGALKSSLANLGLGSVAAAAGALNGGTDRTVTVDGLSMVPRTVDVHMFDGVGGYVAVLAAFALGSSLFVLLMTVLVVRIRRQ